jgi:hypothetical protein
VTVAEVRVLPEVVDFTLVTSMAGTGALVLTIVGALLRLDHDRLARLTLLGMVLGGGIGTALFMILLAREAL